MVSVNMQLNNSTHSSANTTAQSAKADVAADKTQENLNKLTQVTPESEVTLSDEGKALLKALQTIDDKGATTSSAQTVSDTDSVAEEDTAVKAAATDAAKTDTDDVAKKDKSVGDHLESFTYGALGMDSPDKIEKEDDDSYSAGQYVSAAATLGGIISILV